MPTATSPSTQVPSQTTDQPSLPSATTFNILPPLHPILARLLTNDLSPKDLHAAAAPIFVRIHRAKEIVGGLEGGDMGLKEQEELIALLEAQVERAEGVAQGLRGSVRDGG